MSSLKWKNKRIWRSTSVKNQEHCVLIKKKKKKNQGHCGLWLKEGDTNARFFQNGPTFRMQAIFIGDLEVDEVKYSDSGLVKEAVTQFYLNLFWKSVEWRHRVERYRFHLLMKI